jgi:PAS domain S-box-containing protein
MTTRRTSGSAGQATRHAPAKLHDASNTLNFEILRGLPLGVVVLHLENPDDISSYRIVDINPAAAEITGATREDLLGRTLAEFPKLLNTPFPHRCQEGFRARSPRNLGEISYGDERIREGIYSVQIFPLTGNFLGVFFENVTERRQAEQSLRESEERFRLLIQGIQEYAIFQLDPVGQVVTWSSGAERLKGYKAEEIIGRHFSVFYPLEDIQKGKPEKILGEAVRLGHIEDEGWRVRKDGSKFWANVVLSTLHSPLGNLRGFIKLTRDMTGRREKEESLTKAKQLLELRVEQRTALLNRINQELRTEIADRVRAEEQLKTSLDQLRALAARIQSVREEERAAIAREIHDELGQACTAIKMDLALIGHKTTKQQSRLRAKVAAAIQVVDDMIVTLRRIASDLRPRTLDDLGLTAAIEWQVQEFQNRTGIRCRVTLPEDPLVLDVERSTAIFRIFQESLTNVARHAQASRVEALLEKDASQIRLQVNDNGKGFDLEEVKGRKSLGLVGMQERALLLNGEIKVESSPGQGTTMSLRIPLSSTTPPAHESK